MTSEYPRPPAGLRPLPAPPGPGPVSSGRTPPPDPDPDPSPIFDPDPAAPPNAAMNLSRPLRLMLAAALAAVGVYAGVRGSSALAAEKIKPPAAEASLATPGADPQTAVFAGGCFWCIEAVYESFDGVHEAVSGYAGGDASTATYYRINRGDTGHAEAVEVAYDPEKISYARLLQLLFASVDPTDGSGVFPDFGSQYRPAVFVVNDDQRRVAEAYIAQLNTSGVYDAPVEITVEPLDAFYKAEPEHQDYVDRTPNSRYVKTVSLPKREHVRKLFPEWLKPELRSEYADR